MTHARRMLLTAVLLLPFAAPAVAQNYPNG